MGLRVPAGKNNVLKFMLVFDRLYVVDTSRWDEGRDCFEVVAVYQNEGWA
jgi:hypothetical protein